MDYPALVCLISMEMALIHNLPLWHFTRLQEPRAYPRGTPWTCCQLIAGLMPCLGQTTNYTHGQFRVANLYVWSTSREPIKIRRENTTQDSHAPPPLCLVEALWHFNRMLKHPHFEKVLEGQQSCHYVRPKVAHDQAPLCQQVGSFTLSLFGTELTTHTPGTYSV